MIPMHGTFRLRIACLPMLLLVLTGQGCAPAPTPASRAVWVAGAPMPVFDPHGVADPLREVLERSISRGLTELDSLGAVMPALAARWAWSADRCTLRFTLRAGLRFADDSLVHPEDVRTALVAALARTDHRRSGHLLAAVKGVEPGRARKVTPLGIEAVDDSTLVFALSRPDSMLPAKLALHGISAPWRGDRAGWASVVGCGPYRVVGSNARRSMRLVRRDGPLPFRATVDTLDIRFEPSVNRVRDLLRDGVVDVLWPLPPAMLDSDPPAGYKAVQAAARPERRLVLVLRADRPPLTRFDRRLKLSRTSESKALISRLGRTAHPVGEWVKGGGTPTPVPAEPIASPGFGAPVATQERPSSRSFHFKLGWDVDGPAARAAGLLEERWAEAGLYVEREPLRGARLASRARAREGPPAMLLMVQPLFEGPSEAIAPFVESPSGVTIVGFRTGWRPQDLQAAHSGLEAIGPEVARERLEAERVAIPIARIDWSWFERSGRSGARSHPRFGVEHTEPKGPADSPFVR